MEVRKLKAETIKSLPDYAVCLCLSLVSTRSLELYQATAIQAGILSDEETEHAKTIIWEYRRLEQLVNTQIQKIEERMPEKVDVLAIVSKMAGKRSK